MANGDKQPSHCEFSDGVAGFLRDNPRGQDRFFEIMAKKPDSDVPNTLVARSEQETNVKTPV
ncbi:MAG: hypothetical protein AAGL24_08720 [Pseudomonadota bacterium]